MVLPWDRVMRKGKFILPQRGITIARSPFGGLVALSLIMHCAVLAALTWWSSRMPARPPVTIITVDIRTLELSQSQPQLRPAVGSPSTRPVTARHEPSLRTLAKPETISSPPTTLAAPAKEQELPRIVTLREPSPEPIVSSSPRVSQAAAPQQTESDVSRQAPADQVIPAPAASAPVQIPTTAHAAYLAILRGMIDQNKEYPLMARKGGMEGTVLVRFILHRDGTLKNAAVMRSSGRSLLDKAAVQSITRINRFPPVPETIRGSEVTFDLPVAYKLTGK